MLKLNVLYNAVHLSRSIRPNKYPKIEFEIESKVRHSLLYIPLPFERQIQTSLRTWLCAELKILLLYIGSVCEQNLYVPSAATALA